MHTTIPISRIPRLARSDFGVEAERAVAASLSAGLHKAEANEILHILDRTRPPSKRYRKRYGRKVLMVDGIARINSELYFDRATELRHIALYEIRNRLPAAFAAHGLIFGKGIPVEKLFHNGLLSHFAVSTILSVSTKGATGKTIAPVREASKQEEDIFMKHSKSGAATKHFIAGVNLPIIEAEPEVVVAFDKYRADAIKDADTEVDEIDDIEMMLQKGKELLGTLQH